MSKVISLARNKDDTFDVGEKSNTNDLLSIDEPANKKKRGRKSKPISSDTQQDELEAQEFSEERARIINKIKLYKENFPESCALVDMSSLTYMDEDQLEEYLYNIRTVVSNRNNTNMVEAGINGAILGFETMASTYYPKLKGIHAELNMKEAYHSCLKEIAIEHCNLGYIRPEIRLMMIVGGVCAEKMAQPDSVVKPITDEEDDKYKDL